MFFGNYSRGVVPLPVDAYMQQSQHIPYAQQMPQLQNVLQMQSMPQAQYMPCLTGFNSAYAVVVAGPDYPSITGMVTFTDVPGGVMVCANISGLPPYKPAAGEKQPIGPFGFHIHEKDNCIVGDPAKPFEACGGHYNPTNQPHGNHAGDFPVLIADNGHARMSFITDKFRVSDILGRSVMIHENPDDYRTQPAGNSGKRIACGGIKPWNAYQQAH